MSAPLTMAPPTLGQALIAAGVELPEECVDIRIDAPVDGLMQIVFTCNVTPELAVKIANAIRTVAVAERVR
jgi:hypothetical protein